MIRSSLLLLVLLAGACDGEGSGIDPTDVRFGETVLLVIVNPVVNDANRGLVPTPGLVRAGVEVRSDDGPSGMTGPDGIAVLARLSSGVRTIEVEGGGIAASFQLLVGRGALREVALAAEGQRAEVMVDASYSPEGIVEVSPETPTAEINAALHVDDGLVFLTAGTYPGDLDVSASRATVISEGILGGKVTLQGNVTISGASSRIRGARVMGNLSIRAGDTGLSFSRVDGMATAAGGNMTLLANAFCGTAAITGSVSYVVGNSGIAPTTACP